MLSEYKICEDIRSAILSERVEIVEKLLNKVDKFKSKCQVEGCDCTQAQRVLNELCIEGETFLGLATKLNKCDIVKCLLSKGASPNIMNKQSLTAYDMVSSDAMKQLYVDEFFWAVCKNNVRKIQELCLAGMSINTTENEDSKNTLLHVAARYSNKHTVAYLLRCGAEMNALNSYGATPLHEALSHSNGEIAEILINYGANLHIKPHSGKFAGKSAADLLTEPQIEKLFNKIELESPVESTSTSSVTSSKSTTKHHEPRSKPPSKSVVPFDEVIKKLKHLRVSGTSVKSYVQKKLNLLWPPPQKVVELMGAPFMLSEDLFISVRTSSVSFHKILDVWTLFRTSFAALKIDVVLKDIHPNSIPCDDSLLECNVNKSLFPSEDCYQIHVVADKITIQSGGLVGLYYALSTFTQLLKLNNSSTLAPVLIQDYPDTSHRAVLLDISAESRVPVMERLFDIVDNLSLLKINFIHLYVRFTNSTSWDHCYKQSEIVHLDRYTQDRFINLVPILEIDLEITDEILAKMWPIFQRFLSSFSNLSYVHIGPYLSMRLVKNIDKEPLINEIYHLLNIDSSITIMLCTNELNHCKILPKFTNFLLINYDFQNGNSFFDSIELYNNNGFVTMFCAGTTSWDCLAGCPEISLYNIFQGIRAVRRVNSVGFVAANWPGFFLITSVAFAWPGFLIASGLSWNYNLNLDDIGNTLSRLLDAFIFETDEVDNGIGHVIMGLGYIECEALRMNDTNFNVNPVFPHSGSIFYQLLIDSNNVNTDNFSAEFFESTIKTLKKMKDYLTRVVLKRGTSDQIVEELNITAELMLCACKIGQGLTVFNANMNKNTELSTARKGIVYLPATLKTEISERICSIRDTYSEVWFRQNLPSGLQKSTDFFNIILRKFVPNNQLNKV